MVSGNDELVDDFPEQFRSYSETEKHWQARRTFILRNVPPEDGAELSPLRVDQLLSLSMVWANHLFMGCSYNKDLLEKVTEMAEGIEVEDAPHFTTRDEIMKKKHYLCEYVIFCPNMKLSQLRRTVEDRRAWRDVVYGVAKSRTRLCD